VAQLAARLYPPREGVCFKFDSDNGLCFKKDILVTKNEENRTLVKLWDVSGSQVVHNYRGIMCIKS